jgi:hypothetical protein
MGLGPLGARASAVRPPADPDTYGGIKTWFKNCSAAGAADGTVPTASWFNFIIGQFDFAATQAGVVVPNDQTVDRHLWDIIQNSITQRFATTGSGTMGVGSII